ncbi:hypothetical protein AGMMS50268_29660 [Spirochaetia bacterium]|nr:hypothetical protein AGMMS49587_04650 [Spirochaetia bacterium]GHV92463.1 hypothetical protein AGMMS50268_29660 [Spirochaetia bacterium]
MDGDVPNKGGTMTDREKHLFIHIFKLSGEARNLVNYAVGKLAEKKSSEILAVPSGTPPVKGKQARKTV